MHIDSFFQSIAQGTVEMVDLTTPLSPATPVVPVPAPFAPTAPLSVHPVSNFDEAGPGWRWNDLTIGEHAGTHVDAPQHWISGKDGKSVEQIEPTRLAGPIATIDLTDGVAGNQSFLLGTEHLEAWEAEHGRFRPGTWVLARTGWSERASDPERFVDPAGWPGISLAAAKWLAAHPHVSGYGVEAIGIDNMGSGPSEPEPGTEPDPGAFGPGHYYLLGADKYGLTSLRNLERLPATGAYLVVAPLPLVGGTGAPARAFAFVPRDGEGR
ncbi:cyclase family protein [Amycolatopsis orientalis]|uniref:cyclase family protein n=1 Tax=Amycolatopsis orientalis TaxID=31958 RepID=UPI0003AA91BF|nr:cyclase family protein [Amycolatopsis orientalis]